MMSVSRIIAIYFDVIQQLVEYRAILKPFFQTYLKILKDMKSLPILALKI